MKLKRHATERSRYCHLMSVVTVAALAGCAGSLSPSSLADAKSASARTYARYCQGCHALPHPGRLSAAGWRRLYPIMEEHMVQRGLPKPNEEERRTILGYLQSHGR